LEPPKPGQSETPVRRGTRRGLVTSAGLY